MKKIQSLKLMFLGLFVLGSSNAMAQEVGATIEDANYTYTVTKASEFKNNAWTIGEVKITSLKNGGATTDANKNLIFPATVVYSVGASKTYYVTTMEANVFKNNALTAQHAVIPWTLKVIPQGAFNTLTNLFDLTFGTGPNGEGSQVKKIEPQAFASTQIQKFDFSPCTELEGLMDGVFVEARHNADDPENVNANIRTIILPTSTNFKHINGALRNLTKLGAPVDETLSPAAQQSDNGQTGIINLENSWVRELVDGAFSGCESLLELSLPGNDMLYISSKALEGSAIKKLSVNAGTGVTNGNPLKLLGGCTVAYKFDEVNKQYIYNYDDIDGAKATQYDLGPWEGDAWNPADANTNLYGLTADDDETAPLINLTITGKLQGKICKNAFAWCEGINDEALEDDEDGIEAGINLAGIQFGTKAQIEEHAFLGDKKITELILGDIKDNRLANNAYTIDQNAFEGCPIATLTLGSIETANAIGSAAFGINLKEVVIGTVKAGAAAFAGGEKKIVEIIANDGTYDNSEGVLGAFVWDNVSATTLKIAQGNGYVSSDNPDNGTFVVPAGVFDFSNVKKANITYPEIWIGKIASEGGVFADNAIVGPKVDKLHFTGDIEANGLATAILDNGFKDETPATEYTYVQEDRIFTEAELTENGGNPEDAISEEMINAETPSNTYVQSGADYKLFLSYVPAVEDDIETPEVDESAPAKINYAQTDVTKEALGVGDEEVAPEDDDEAAVNKWIQVEENVWKQIASRVTPAENVTYDNSLSELTFAGKLKSNAIGTGAFTHFSKLAKLEFHGLMSKEAVASLAFEATGKVTNGNIGSKTAAFVVYDAALAANDAYENPFASDAFATAENGKGENRIIYWSVGAANDPNSAKLAASILGAIQIDEVGAAEDGKEYLPKFNVYRWVALLAEPEEAAHGFIVFTDSKAISLDQNVNKKLAWGRYDLGSFEAEKGIFYDPNATREELEANPEKAGYQASDMLITRFMKAEGDGMKATGVTTGTEYNVKLTLYGVYWDQDPYAEQSSVYMVPLQVIDGQYQISKKNTHLIIVKVENKDGEFADDQILIDYDEDPAEEGDDDGDDPIDDTISDDTNDDNPDGDGGDEPAGDEEVDYTTFWGGNSVWQQLQDETNAEGPSFDTPRVFEKATATWTNQELVDAVTNEGGSQDVIGKDLYAMLNPAANAGFDIKRFVIERNTTGNGAYIGIGWYYALLNNYAEDGEPRAARIIWLDDAQATAIFGAKSIVEKGAANNSTIYNMQGIRVNKASKGVYIKNGQKYVVK